MRGKLKLLCFLIISFFMIGIGGVEARVFNSRGTLSYRHFNVPPYVTQFQWFYPADDSSSDAWCLNSEANPSSGYDLPLSGTSLIPASKKNSIINILTASKNLNLEPGVKYYITQAAIWYVLNGTGKNGITPNFKSWIETNYSSAWNSLVGKENLERTENSYSLTINGTDYTMSEDGNYLVSKDFSVSAQNISGQITVIIDSGSSDGACVLYNNQCSTQVNVDKNSNFKIRVNKPTDAAGTVDASFTVAPVESLSEYDINTYIGFSNFNVQNIAVLVSNPKNLSANQKVKGKYTNFKALQIKKVDAETGDPIEGAKLYIQDESGKKIGNYTTPENGIVSVNLPVGVYYLGEKQSTSSYFDTDERVQFEVYNDGGVLKVKDEDGNAFPGDTPTISLENISRKIKFRKVDSEGNPVSGIQFEIQEYGDASTGYDKIGVCAVTDEQGYLTIPCSQKPAEYIDPTTDGVYVLGVDFARNADGFYRIIESCPEGNTSCQQYLIDGKSTSFYGKSQAADFGVNGNGENIILLNPNLSIEEIDGTDANHKTILMNLINRNYIKIKKTNITGSGEVEGAILTVIDLTLPTNSTGNMSADNIVDSWKSTTKAHEIIGIIPGRKYQLIEEQAADGYTNVINFAKNVSKIDFVMDSKGKITTYDSDTGEEIKDFTGSNYELFVKNDLIKTEFSKTSAVTGEEIAGAELKVCTEESYNLAKQNTGDGNNCTAFERTNSKGEKEVISWVSEEGKTKTIEALPAGKYYLVENIAPVGYIKQTNSAAFEVKADGTITKVEMTNEPTKVVISKKDITTGEEIEGAQIKICTAESYKQDGKDCKPSSEELAWTSGKESKVIEALPFGDYVLIETLPAPKYEEGMIIEGDLMTAYEFSISQDNGKITIDVYNQLLTDVPSTGISTLNLFAIGGLMVFAGYETIKIYRRKALNN